MNRWARVLICLFASLFLFAIGNVASAQNNGVGVRVIVIDAGHGGEDAGAISQDGTLEKDLNLKIALCLDALCEINGNSAVFINL